MNVLIAIDSFKGSLSTTELSDAIEAGIKMSNDKINVKKMPIADGGEGTTITLIEGLNGQYEEVVVKDPLFRNLKTRYGILQGTTAIMEMASSSGLTLLFEDERNPMHTTTYGVGDMIKDAIKKGVRKFIIGIGGSATNDAGIGMLASLGAKFYDKSNNLLQPVGESLNKIAHIDLSDMQKELAECEFLIACDVDNPLYGKNGAAYVYAPQKGASLDIVKKLDQGLQNFSNVVKQTIGKNLATVPGTGAAGGLGYGFLSFLNAKLKPGIDIIFDMLSIEKDVIWSDIVITGEGRLDFQTVMGKAPIGIAKLAKKYQKPVVALSGAVTDDAIVAHEHGISAMFSILDQPMSLEEAMDKENARKMVIKKAHQLFNLIDAIK